MEFKDALQWLVTGGGGAVLGYWFMENSEYLKGLVSKVKRYVGLALPGVFALLGWELFVLIGYETMPATILETWEVMFAVASAAVLAQAVHGELKLSKKSSCCEESRKCTK